MEVDGASPLNTMKVDSRISREKQCLVGTGHIYHLDDFAVEVRLEEDLVTLRYEIPWQSHDRWWSHGGGREGWTGCWVHCRDLSFVQNDHGDNASYRRDSKDDKSSGGDLGYV